jgi:hypothetical protein
VTPYENALGIRPDLSRFLGAPGAPCYVRREGVSASSLGDAASPAIFIGPEMPGAAFLVIDLSTMREVHAFSLWLGPSVASQWATDPSGALAYLANDLRLTRRCAVALGLISETQPSL